MRIAPHESKLFCEGKINCNLNKRVFLVSENSTLNVSTRQLSERDTNSCCLLIILWGYAANLCMSIVHGGNQQYNYWGGSPEVIRFSNTPQVFFAMGTLSDIVLGKQRVKWGGGYVLHFHPPCLCSTLRLHSSFHFMTCPYDMDVINYTRSERDF